MTDSTGSQRDAWLREMIGKRVRVAMDDPEGYFDGVLTELRPSGPRVKFDSPYLRERTVAARRIGGTGRMNPSLSDVGWPSEPPIPLYGHGGACDRIRQALTALGAEASILRPVEPEAAARVMTGLERIERVVAELEGRSAEVPR